MVTRTVLTAGLCTMLIGLPALAQGAYYNTPPNTPPNYQQGRAVYVPSGMVIPVTLNTSISTSVAKPGDVVQATLNKDVTLGDAVIPQGSIISGHIVNTKSGGFLNQSGMLTIKFDQLRTPGGYVAPMSAHILGGIGKYTQVDNDTIHGETWKAKVGQTAIRGAVGAGAGAALGTAVGAIAGHSPWAVGRGAWSGTAIGGGLGVADGLLLRKGRDVQLASGLPIQLQLDTPMTLSQQAVYTGTL